MTSALKWSKKIRMIHTEFEVCHEKGVEGGGRGWEWGVGIGNTQASGR